MKISITIGKGKSARTFNSVAMAKKFADKCNGPLAIRVRNR